MKIAQLITPEEILLYKNTTLVADDFDFDANLSIDASCPSLFEYFMKRGEIEYGVFRLILQNSCVPNWSILSFEERKICVKYFKYPSDLSNDEYLTYYLMEQHKDNWRSMIYATTGRYIIQDSIRGRRLVEMIVETTWTLTPLQVAIISESTLALIYRYAIGNNPGLSLWLSNGIYAPLAINYSTNGFSQTNGYSDALRDKLLDILINGNY